jgi:ribose transport system ATP-binding protein
VAELSRAGGPIVALKGISKSFGATRVLRDVDFAIYPGEVHLLAGENGAGKSTLIKILAGVHQDYSGTIELEGASVRPNSPAEAQSLGIAVIYQELSIVPSMTVADNLFLGGFLCRSGFVSDRRQHEEARKLLAEFDMEVDPGKLAGDLPVSAQQMIEIARALRSNGRVVVMDEPTSALNAVETERLYGLIARLKERGCGIVYITHKMEEIYRVADRITVLRDGTLAGAARASELPVSKLIEWMVGRNFDEQFYREQRELGAELLRVDDLTVRNPKPGLPPLVDGVSFRLRSGEILGVAGLQGSGNSELLWALFGALRQRASGSVVFAGERLDSRSPRGSISKGLALLTNDRKATGLVLSMSVVANITLASIARHSPAGWRISSSERAAAESAARAVRLRARSLEMETGQLSGGNQQKVALAKWMETRPKLLLLDDPTRGVDVGAKFEIYQLMNEWTAAGTGILLISSELPELLGMSDRVMVMHRGRVSAMLEKAEAVPQTVLAAAMGQRSEQIQ